MNSHPCKLNVPRDNQMMELREIGIQHLSLGMINWYYRAEVEQTVEDLDAKFHANCLEYR